MELRQINFNVSTAKKIADGKLYGYIKTKSDYNVRIVDWNFCDSDGYTLVGAIWLHEKGVEILQKYNIKGIAENSINDANGKVQVMQNEYDLHLEVPTYYRDYSNFVPQKYQPCLVRDRGGRLWGVQVYSHSDCQGKMLFYNEEGYVIPFVNVLPLSKVTKRLIGTKKSYEELIKELDAEYTKNKQQ